MRRREFITLLGGAVAAWPLAAWSQQSKLARIGALYIGTADEEALKTNLREGLRELGYVEGQNIEFEFRSAEGKLDRLPGLAAELVRREVWMKRRFGIALAAAILTCLCHQGAAQAGEVRLLSALVMRPVLSQLAGAFEQNTGHTLNVSYDSAGG